MTVFSPDALSQSPQDVTEYLVGTGGAPAAIVSISNGSFQGFSASGNSEIGGDPAKPDQSFEIGSQTKMMTAVVVLQLAKEGLLDLDQTLSHYLEDDLIQGVANADVATLSQALNMTTGMPNYTEVERPDGTTMLEIIEDNPGEIFDTEEIVALLNGLPATGSAGDTYTYSNTDYFYLSEVIEAVTGQTLGDVFQDRIFDPLNMQDSFVNDFRNDPDRLSSYLEIDGEFFDVTNVLVDANGEGGVISTTADMTTFIQALLVDQTLVSADILETMTDFENGSFDEAGFVFNAGLVFLEVEGIGSFVGFSGGSLGTDSATYLHLESGRIISLAVTQSNLDIDATSGLLYSAILADQDDAWAQGDLEGPIQIDGISAADLHFASGGGSTTLVADNASLTLSGNLRHFESSDFEFSDGSQLVLGSQDNDVLRISKTDGEAWNANNQLRGYGGDDLIVGGQGDDRMFGGQGDDRLNGHGGEDTLSGGKGSDTLRAGSGDDVLMGGRGDDHLKGGSGADWIKGGAGDDVMTGGKGADVFVFRGQSDDSITDFDVVTDFQVGIDALALGSRHIANTTQHEDGLMLTLDGDGDTILLCGVNDLADLTIL